MIHIGLKNIHSGYGERIQKVPDLPANSPDTFGQNIQIRVDQANPYVSETKCLQSHQQRLPINPFSPVGFPIDE